MYDMCCCFFFNATAPTEIYTLSLHDALPIYEPDYLDAVADLVERFAVDAVIPGTEAETVLLAGRRDALPVPVIAKDRKSTRLNSSHMSISYAVFCLKKKKEMMRTRL